MAVAANQSTVVVGAPFRDSGKGAAYVFQRSSSGLVQVAELAGGGTNFGESVAISGNTIFVGASDTPTIYVFVRPTGGWSSIPPTAVLNGIPPAAEGFNTAFEISLATVGDVVVAGAPGTGFGENLRQGTAYVYVQPQAGWADAGCTAQLTASDGTYGDNFGWSVGMSGDAVILGSPVHLDRGAAYVFMKPPVAG